MKALIHRDEVLRAMRVLMEPGNADRFFSDRPDFLEVEVQPVTRDQFPLPLVIPEDKHG